MLKKIKNNKEAKNESIAHTLKVRMARCVLNVLVFGGVRVKE